MIEIGRICMKIAGRDAGKLCVIVDTKDGRVIIDGQTRRRLCNPKHLEPINKKLDIKKGASREEVKTAFEKINIKLKDKKPKAKTQRPRKKRISGREKPKTEQKPVKKPKS